MSKIVIHEDVCKYDAFLWRLKRLLCFLGRRIKFFWEDNADLPSYSRYKMLWDCLDGGCPFEFNWKMFDKEDNFYTDMLEDCIFILEKQLDLWNEERDVTTSFLFNEIDYFVFSLRLLKTHISPCE